MATRALVAVLALNAAALTAGSHGAPDGAGQSAGQTVDQAARQATGIILGRVLDADTGTPVAGATVIMLPPLATRRPREEVLTDHDGRFLFRDLEPGAYRLQALKFGLIPAEHGQRRPRGPFQRLSVPPNEPVTDATIRMWRPAAISGVVTDDAGEPAVGVSVNAVQVTMSGGQRLLSPNASDAMTDDRGVFRLASLSPGQYYVMVPSTVESAPTSTAAWYAEARAAAGAERALLQQFGESRAPAPSPSGLRVGDHIISTVSIRSATAPSLTADGRLEVYRTVYHPSALTTDRAAAVVVASGEQRANVDVQLVRETAQRVSGQVIGTEGPAALIGVRLISADVDRFDSDFRLATAATTTGQDGTFTLLGVPPGQYVIEVLRVPRPDRTSRSAADTLGSGVGSRTRFSTAPPSAPPMTVEVPDVPTLWARQALTVADADIEGVTLQLREGARILGRIVFEGRTPAPEPDAVARLAVRLMPADGREDSAFLRSPGAARDGTFRTLGHPPGRYFVDVVGSLPGAQWHAKSAVLGSRDLLDQPIELEGDDVGGVVITMTDELGGLTGTVALAPDGPDAALVAVFPADVRSWMANGMPASRTATALTDGAARFDVRPLRPGAYVVVALRPDAEPDLQDPAVIDRLARAGTQVQVPERGSASVRLAVSQVR